MPEIAASQPSSSGAITIAGRQIPVRVCLVWACVAIWIGNMILHTGSAGITALWTSLLFLTQIIVITSATRTVSLDQVATFYCLGGAMMTVVWLIDHGITMIGPDGNAERLFAPFLEES